MTVQPQPLDETVTTAATAPQEQRQTTWRHRSGAARAWSKQTQAVQVQVFTVYFALRDPRMPWFAKAAAALAVGYIFSPVQLIPDWIPVIGWTDDLLVLALALACMRCFTPRLVVAACHERAEQAVMRRANGAAQSSQVVIVAAVALIAMWLAVGILGSAAILHAVSSGR
jgi:uncharacterized membrane protein YkvA (DUF1232 family)